MLSKFKVYFASLTQHRNGDTILSIKHPDPWLKMNIQPTVLMICNHHKYMKHLYLEKHSIFSLKNQISFLFHFWNQGFSEQFSEEEEDGVLNVAVASFQFSFYLNSFVQPCQLHYVMCCFWLITGNPCKLYTNLLNNTLGKVIYLIHLWDAVG